MNQVSKHTTTLYEIIESELQRLGLNEFVNNDRIHFNDLKHSFMQKMLYFDDDVKQIVDHIFFKGFMFNDERIDRYFKESFTLRFLYREIGRQTVEAFASQVLYITMTHEDYIYRVYGSDMYKYIEQMTDTQSTDIGKALENAIEQGQTKDRQQDKSHEEYQDHEDTVSKEASDDRSAESTLPQSKVNIDVDNTVLDYADTNNISRKKSGSETLSDKEGTKDSTYDSLRNGESDTKRNTESQNEMNRTGLTKQYLIDNLQKLYSMRDTIFKTYDKECFLHIW